MKHLITRSLIGMALLAAGLGDRRRGGCGDSQFHPDRPPGGRKHGRHARRSQRPANTIVTTAGDLVTLRGAGVPEAVIMAIQARLAQQPTAPLDPLQPDDLRLVDLVLLVQSGLSESIIAEQVKQSTRRSTCRSRICSTSSKTASLNRSSGS